MAESLTGHQCWKPALISKVINREALEIDTSYFMVTHAPMHQIIYERAPYQMSDLSEEGLFNEMLRRANENLHTFTVLKGIPGTGKSHLIRWLYERFVAYQREQGDDSEVALLIRRANSSLANTLLQIVESGLFDNRQFQDQVESLKSATSNLTEQALSNQILSGLQEATRAVKSEEYNPLVLPSKRVIAFSPNFLLDPAVRAFLERPDNAVDRIASFLSGIGRTSSQGEEMPSFEARDFEFPAAEAQRKVSNPEAKRMVSALLANEDMRIEVAAYYNSLLNFAVEKLTTITVDELKRMFNELRRYLRQQNKSLALFIEDITAFTGLDAALIDVLATQHGEGNPDFCRLISLIGITDSYYQDRFPDNMRERITFQLALNISGGDHARFLNSSSQVADMSARYLNAMRLLPEEIELWYDRGADPTDLPNACIGCDFRSQCHAAFGYVSLNGRDDERSQVGLYPFNQNALGTMYDQIDVRKTTRTPRSLLNSVIAYVMQSHGQKVGELQFPPPPAELGSDFVPPAMPKPQQRRIIIDRAGSPTRVERLQSLILFWGDRTLDVTEYAGTKYVSRLPKEVYDTFDLPFITEGTIEVLKEAPSVSSADESVEIREAPQDEIIVSPPNPYAADIAQWARKEGRLENYEILARRVVNFIKDAIDWNMYGVSRTQVDDRIRQARFVIDNQAGRSVSKPRFVLKNTPEFEQVLYAVADIEVGNLASTKLGNHLATISSWLNRHQTEIIDFVRQPDETITQEPLPLVRLLTIDVLLLAVLSGDLAFSDTSSREIFKRLVRTASDKDFNREYKAFRGAPDRIHGRNKSWIDVTRRLTSIADDVRSEFFVALNCPQGTSRQVRYIDADLAIRALDGFLKEWQFQDYPLPEFGSRKTLWEKAGRVYQESRLALHEIIETEQEDITHIRFSLLNILGQDDFGDAWKEIETFIEFAQSQAKERIPAIPEGMTKRKLEYRLGELEKPEALDKERERILWVSSRLDIKRETQEYLDFLEQLLQRLDMLQERLTEEAAAPEMVDLDQKVTAVRDLYVEIEDLLMTLIGDEFSEEAE